jgi:CubicO group peptidase (beta-lactamase class C family)
MRRYIRFLSVQVLFVNLFLVFTTARCQQAPAYSKEKEETIAKVEKNLGGWVQVDGASGWSLADRMKFYHVHGISIAVIKNYQIDWARGYGLADSQEDRPVTTATLFQAGSISKSLNAVGVLKLVQSGRLDLNADINRYLKTWKFPYDTVSRGKKITVANLLSHTAGLSIHGFPGYAQGDTLPTLSQVLDGRHPANTQAVRSEFEPSLRFQYSGGGTTISQMIVQDLTGEAYEVYMQKEVLNPLGMGSSSYAQPPPRQREKLLATAYYNDGSPVKGKYHIYPEKAAAGLWTNPTDLAKYIIETQLALEGKSAKVLGKDMTTLRLRPYIDSSAAFGVFIVQKGSSKYFNHNGVDEGFVALYYGSMTGGNGVVVMANTYSTNILDEIANSVATVYGWKGFYQPELKHTVSVSDQLLDAYAGRYHDREDTFFLAREKDGMYVRDHEHHMKMYFTSPTEFFVQEADHLNIQVTRDSTGKVDGLNFIMRSSQRKGSRLQ